MYSRLVGGEETPARGAGEGGEGSSSAERCAECGALLPEHRYGCALAPPLARAGGSAPLRSDAIAAELEALMAQAQRVVIAVRESSPPESPQRPSLPVRAVRSLRPVARGGYRLTRLASSIVGLVVVVAELLAPDHAVARAIFRALFE